MGGKIENMIKTLIIIGLLVIIFTGMSAGDALTYLQIGLDKSLEIVYDLKESVNK
jgi:hypothetical protein